MLMQISFCLFCTTILNGCSIESSCRCDSSKHPFVILAISKYSHVLCKKGFCPLNEFLIYMMHTLPLELVI